jgi:hypothetical protein
VLSDALPSHLSATFGRTAEKVRTFLRIAATVAAARAIGGHGTERSTQADALEIAAAGRVRLLWIALFILRGADDGASARDAALAFGCGAGIAAERAVGIGAERGANAAAASRTDTACSGGICVVLHGIAVPGGIAGMAGATVRAGSGLGIATLPVIATSRGGAADRGRGARNTRAWIWRGGDDGHAGPVLADLAGLLARAADVVGATDLAGQTAVGDGAATAGVADPVASPGAGRAAQLLAEAGAIAAGTVAALRLAVWTAVWTAFGGAGRAAALRAAGRLTARAPGNGRAGWGWLGRGRLRWQGGLGTRDRWTRVATPGSLGVTQDGAGGGDAPQTK